MKNPAKNQMGFLDSSCLFKQSLVSSILLLFIVPFFSYSIFSPAFVTVTVLVASSTAVILFKFSKDKQVSEEAPTREEALVENSNRLEAPPEDENDRKLSPASEAVLPQKDTPVIPLESPDVLPNSGSVDLSSTTDDSDVDWPSPYNANHIAACSDESISDDESLIELVLPDGHYVESVPPKAASQPNSPEYSPESICSQDGLLELLSDINEEDDNLIEIDISMGSIKCSRLKIEA